LGKALTLLYAALIVVSMFSIFTLEVRSEEPHVANALWIEPSSIPLDISKVDVGYRFNVTVWVNLTDNSFTWQVKLLFNNTYFNATRAGYTAGSVSDWATHRTGGATVPVAPVIDNTKGYVLHGESCMGEYYVPGPIVASLMWVEFQLKKIPPTDHLKINFSKPYGEDTLILNPDMEVIAVSNISGADIPVIGRAIHDVAIVGVTASPSEVVAGEPVSINVTVLNEGTVTENFSVSVYYDSHMIGTILVMHLAPGKRVALISIWDTSGVPEGVYTISAVASIVPGETDVKDNTFTDGTVTVRSPVIRKVGVKVGDWAKYDFAINWSSNDPNPPLPRPPSWVFDIEWLMTSVQAVVDTRITFQLTMHFKNGTEQTQTLLMDVNTGYDNTTFFYISANLSKGDRIYSPRYWPTINETITRVYADVAREVNHLNISVTEYYRDYLWSRSLNAYWDRITGVLCEYEALLTITHRRGYVTSISTALKLIETNIWVAPALTTTIHVYPRTLNLKSRGRWITCLIEPPENYSAKDIDASTVMLNGTIQAEWHPKGTGASYLMVKFNRAEVIRYIHEVQGIKYGNVTLTIKGKLRDGTLFKGSDVILVRMPGDVNVDGKVDMKDVSIVARAFGSHQGHQKWNPTADENEDNVIDMKDIGMVCRNFGKDYR
jgi:hypothetical protein